MKVTPGAAMRARDVSRPRPEHLAAAEAAAERAPRSPQPEGRSPLERAPGGPQPEGRSRFERAPGGRHDATRERPEGTRDREMGGAKPRRLRRKRKP